MTERIDSFSGEHSFLSSFHPSPITIQGITWPTVEHAFQAAKTKDIDARVDIRLASTPGKAKRLGRRVELRSDWESIKVDVMEDLLRRKFAPGTALRQQLDATSPAELIEGNHWGDTFWGVCRGVGRNQLGLLLMKIRDEDPA
jgi:ribA/ribD-fused uncharacterized protein